MTEQIRETVLPDGTPAKVLTQAQVAVLLEIIEERLWKNGFKKRVHIASRYVAAGVTVLVGLSVWWPSIRATLDLILSGIPS